MEDTFTDRVKMIIQCAREEAERLSHDYIGYEHVFLGILKEGTGKAIHVLSHRDVHLPTLKESIEDYISTPGHIRIISEFPVVPRVKKVLDTAANEAHTMRSPVVDGEHILLAILKDGSDATTRILKRFGVDYEMVRKELEVL